LAVPETTLTNCNWTWLLWPLEDAHRHGSLEPHRVAYVEEALKRLASGSLDYPCVPALLEARNLLRELHTKEWFAASGLSMAEGHNYPAARGHLYGSLIAALEQACDACGGCYHNEDSSHLQETVGEIWGEIEDNFICNQGWLARHDGFTFARAVTKAFSESKPSIRAYEGLWRAFDTYTSYLLAALEARPPEAMFEEAALDYLNLFVYSVTTFSKAIQQASLEGRAEDLPDQTAFLLARASRVALDVAATTSKERLLHVHDWADGVAQLCDKVLGHGNRPALVQREMRRCGDALWQYARMEPLREVREGAYARAMNHMWLINDHLQGSPRSKVELPCTVSFDGRFTATGMVRNVCMNRLRGFAIELDDVRFWNMNPDEAGLWGFPPDDHDDLVDGAFRRRWINVGPGGGDEGSSLSINHLDLSFEFTQSKVKHVLELRCEILRGWRRGGQVGLAVLAAEWSVDQSTPVWAAWREFAERLHEPGRYNPTNPTDGFPEARRV
jgi:hypothetical protein